MVRTSGQLRASRADQDISAPLQTGTAPTYRHCRPYSRQLNSDRLLAERGLIKGERIGVDASTVEANAALRAIVRRDGGEGYREMLVRMAQESGVETPTAEDLIRLDRKRKGKRLSNAE